MKLEPGTRILAIRIRQLGDVLATLAALAAIKEADQGRRISYMVDERYHRLLAPLAYIDELLPPPRPVRSVRDLSAYEAYIDHLRAMRFDCVLDFHSNPRSALLSLLCGAPVRVGFAARVRRLAYHEAEPRSIVANERARPRTSLAAAMALASRIGATDATGEAIPLIDPDRGQMDRARKSLLAVGASPGAIGLNPGRPYPAKAWPFRKWVELTQALSTAGREVVVLWGPGEREGAEALAAQAGPRAFLAPPLELDQLPAFLRQLGCLITIDSGLKHLAVAARVPTLTLFGPTSPEEWHMGTERDLYLYMGLSCSPCRMKHCPFGSPCMEGISPAQVMELLERILSRGGHS